jgi:hypothetical protein
LIAAGAKEFANQLLGPGLAVDVGRVEMRDAEIDGLVDDPSGRIAIDAPAEIVAAKPDKGDLRAVRPKRASLHFPSPFYVANDRESSTPGASAADCRR